MTHDSNTPVWQWPYSAFGTTKPTGVLVATPNPKAAITNQPVLLKATGATELNLRFPGQYFDAEMGTFYNMQRDAMDPAVGRYRQFDPIGLQGGLNGFAYVGANPLRAVDPTGLLFESTLGGVRRETTLDQAATYGGAGNAAAAMGLAGAVGGATAAGAGAAYFTFVPAPARTAIGLLKGLQDDAIPPPTPPQPPLLTPPAISRPGGFNPPAMPPGICPRL